MSQNVFRGGDLVEWTGVPGQWRVIPSNVYDGKYVSLQRERGNRVHMGVPCEELKKVKSATRPAPELTIYPKLEPPIYGHQIEGYRAQWEAENAERLRKRMTEAELAAEWHKQDNHCGQRLEGYGVAHNGEPLSAEESEIERLRVLYSFATLPHYDEVDA